MPKSDSYRLACCSSDCDYLDAYPDQPCWGAVEGIGDDYDAESGEEYRHHACQGHQGEKYVPEPKAAA